MAVSRSVLGRMKSGIGHLEMSDAQVEMIFGGNCESGLAVMVYEPDGCEQRISKGIQDRKSVV